MGKKAKLVSAAELDLSGLGEWFRRRSRVLPWREEPSPYRVWISEIMLQQTQVATVVPYFERFLVKFPDLSSLAAASEQEVLGLWAGLGYYSRARNLHRAARQLVCEGGGWPCTREGWLALPGVGEYTAGAILSIAFDQPEAILDGNVERVLARARRISRREAGEASYKKTLWGLAGELVSKAHARGIRPSLLNQALMELGATVCAPLKPACERCPWERGCEARKAGDPLRFPEKRARRKWLQVNEAVHCVIGRDGREVLLERRKQGSWRAGLWDLPLKKPSGLRLSALGEIETRHVVTRHKITRLTRVWLLRGVQKTAPSDGLRAWVSIHEPELPVGAALKRTLQQVRERFPEASRRN